MLAREGDFVGCEGVVEAVAGEEGDGVGSGKGWWGRGGRGMVMGDEGWPQGVGTVRVVTGVKPGREERPVPPMTAIRMGSSGC